MLLLRALREAGMLMPSRLEQPENALLPMEVTLSGILMDFRPEQLENTLDGRLSMPEGRTTEVSLLQFWKQFAPIVSI